MDYKYNFGEELNDLLWNLTVIYQKFVILVL
jgi:hypothetical protein